MDRSRLRLGSDVARPRENGRPIPGDALATHFSLSAANRLQNRLIRARRSKNASKARDAWADREWRDLKQWQPSPALVELARSLGLPDKVFVQRLRTLRNSPLPRPVFDRDVYVSGEIEKWARWEVQDKMAVSSAANGPRSGFQRGTGPTLTLEPTERQKRFADDHQIDVFSVVATLVNEGAVEKIGLSRARELISERLMQIARKQRERRSSTA